MTNRITKIILRGDIADLQAKMAVAAKSVGDTADKMTNASRESVKFRSGLTTLGDTAGKVGLVAAAGLGAAVLAAAHFDSAMSKVEAATHETAGNMELLRAAAIKAGADTVFSATEAADAITALAKAGVSTKDVLAGGLSGALSLASAGELDVASAAEIAATAMTQFGLSGKDIPHIADLLAAAAGKAQGEVTDMANSLKYVGPVAHQMGISIEETTGVIAELASQGILGEQAGTSLRGMLTSLTSPSQIAAKTMHGLGIELYDTNGQFVGLRGVAGQLGETMGKLTNAERDQALGRIFGNEQITAARILYAGGVEAVDKWTAAVDEQGYAADTAAIKMDNLHGDLEQLKGSFETALIGLGEGSQGPLRELVQTLTKAVNGFNELPGPIKNVTSGMLAITAITGGGLWFGSKAIRGVSDTRKALKDMNVTLRDAEGNLTRTGVAFKRLTIGAGVLIGLAALDGALSNIDNHNIGPTVNELTNALNALNAGDTKALGKNFGDLGDAIDLVGSKSSGAIAGVEKVLSPLTKLSEAISGGLGFSSRSTATQIDDATSRIETLDQALAGLVTSGSVEQARASFEALAADQHLSGDEQKRLLELLPQYRDAVAGATSKTTSLGAATQGSTADLQAQAKALAASRSAANKTAHEFAGLGDSLNDSKVSLHDWITDLQKQANALRDFTKNAVTAGKKGLKEGLIKELEAAGPEGALRMKQLADASEKEIKRANRAWASQTSAIKHYTDVAGGVPPVVVTELDLRAAAAEAAIARINREIRNIPKQWRTDYYVVQHNAVNKPKVLPGTAGQADGGTIPGIRTPYADKMLTPTAPGEEVISNRYGQADRGRKAAKLINSGRLTDAMLGLADGGTVGMPHPISVSVSGGQGIDYGRMASAVSGDRLLAHRDTRDAMLWAMETALSRMPIMRASQDLAMLADAS